VADFWLTNPVARASKIMNGLSMERAEARAKRQAAE
jgi:predicted outer membrane lipoprotein